MSAGEKGLLELLGYLRANGFATFIVSGGGLGFMRPWTEAVYGIPPEQVIGRRPIFAAGNSDGDYEMLEWTTSQPGARLGILVHQTDAAREYAYDRESGLNTLERGLEAAPEKGWVVVDMKEDWKTIFGWERAGR